MLGGLALVMGAAIGTVFPTPEARLEVDKLVGAMPASMVNLFGNATLMGDKLGTLGGYITWKYGAMFAWAPRSGRSSPCPARSPARRARGSLDIVATTPFGKRRIALEKLAAHLVLLWLAVLVGRGHARRELERLRRRGAGRPDPARQCARLRGLGRLHRDVLRRPGVRARAGAGPRRLGRRRVLVMMLPYSNLSLLAAQWNLMINEGIWYPQGGTGSFCDRLARAVTGQTTRFGEMRLGVEVARINVEHGGAAGVSLKDGEELSSSSVISNGDYKTTFIHLLDPEKIPPAWRRAVSQSRQTGSVLQVCLGVDTSRVDLACFREAARLIYRRNLEDLEEKEEIDWSVAEVDPETLCRRELEVSLWSKDDTSLAPEGKDVIIIRVEADYSHFAKYKLGWRKRSPAYLEYKTRLGRALAREAELLVPGLEKSVVVMDVATPLTFEDQGGRSGGAVAGWSWDYQDFHDATPRELVRTPIRGLYMAGYQAYSALFLGGIPTAMESGKRSAEAVLNHADPTEEILIPGAE